jgi:hypothetical protein
MSRIDGFVKLLLALSLATSPLFSHGGVGGITKPSNIIYVANEAGTGTVQNKLVKLTGAPSTAIVAAITDASGIVGICISGCGTTGTAIIQVWGQVNCVFDSATTAGHYLQIDTSTAGACMDSGAATPPTSGQSIGRILSTNGGAGTYEIDLFPADIQPGGAGGHIIQNAGVPLPAEPDLNFTGAGVNCADDPGNTGTKCTIPGGTAGAANYSKPFVGVGSLTITNAEHGYGHPNLLVSCYDGSVPPQYFEPATITVNSATFQVDVTFAGPTTGHCVVNGGSGPGAGTPTCALYTIASTNATFIVASSAADVTLFTLPQYGKISGSTIKHSAQFSDGAGAMTDVTVSIGNAVAPYTQYTAASSIGELTPVADTTFYDTVAFKSITMAVAGDAVSAHFISTGRDFGNGAATFLTGGSVSIWVCSLRVQ